MVMFGKLPMIFISGFSTNLGGLFGSLEEAKMNEPTIYSYICAPFLSLFMPAHTLKSGCIRFCNGYVLHILPLRSLAKIIPSIIGGIFIFVIDLALRPFPRHHRPDDHMGTNDLAPYAYRDPAVRGDTPGSISRLSASCRWNFPKQFARFRIVAEHLMELGWGRSVHAVYIPRMEGVSS
jgi:hypothetical protein